MNHRLFSGRIFLLAGLVICFAVMYFAPVVFAESTVSRTSPAEQATPIEHASPGVLPPLPAGVTEIRFRDFYELPIGPRGLKPTEKLLALNGKRVRMLGFMAKQEEPSAGMFILTPVPVAMAEAADGPADDLPATAVFVHWQTDHAEPVPYTPSPLLLTGTLAVGSEDETDGRVSAVRLLLDVPASRLRAATARQ